VAAQLNALNKELQGKDKLITEMSDRIEAFKFKLWLWDSQLKVHILVEHLKSVDIVFPERVHE
jgi:hypothetical protein